MLPYLFFVSYFINGAAPTIISQRFTAHLQDFILAFITYRSPRLRNGRLREGGDGGGGLRVTLNKEAEIRKPVPPVLYSCSDDGKCARVSRIDAPFLLAII